MSHPPQGRLDLPISFTNSAASPASSSGASIAAKCPPCGISVQRTTLYPRSTHDLGGLGSSYGNRATAQGASTRCPWASRSGVRDDSRYSRIEEAMELVTQYSVTFVSSQSIGIRLAG